MKYLHLFVIAIFSTLLFSCEEDKPVPKSEVSIQVTLPEEYESKDNITLEFSEINTGKKETAVTDAEGKLTIIISEGIYNIVATGTKTRTRTLGKEVFQDGEMVTVYEDMSQEVKLVGMSENTSISGKTFSLSITLALTVESKGWVLKELYFTGSKTPEGKQYRSDKYFEIYNNSDAVLYADGISLVESAHFTFQAENRWNTVVDIKNATVAGVIFTIPGTGTDHPVQPGESIVLCDVGINHQTENPNSFDLSTADFEWFEDFPDMDVDVPEVPNLIKNYSYSLRVWSPHNRGYCSYLIFKQEGSMEDFLEANMVQVPNASGSKMITRYKIPNEYVLDAVEVSTPSGFASKAFDTSLDFTYTHCGDGNAERFGKCIRRKVLKVVDGRKIYQDTNNSAEDFESTVTPMPGIN